jgi:hypothetical protein
MYEPEAHHRGTRIVAIELPIPIGAEQAAECGRYFRVEFQQHRWGACCYPMGVAYVHIDEDGTARLRYVNVVDNFRRAGIGTQLLLACRRLWPQIDFGGAGSDEGEALLAAVKRRKSRPRLVVPVSVYDADRKTWWHNTSGEPCPDLTSGAVERIWLGHADDINGPTAAKQVRRRRRSA